MSKEGASSRRASVVTRTERLLLRDLRSSDREAVHKYSSDPDVVQYMDWGPNTDKDDKEFLERTITAQKENPRRNFTLAIVIKDTRRLIGSCGIHESNPADREGWIGYCLNRRYWHQGFGTETAKALLEFGFNHLRLHRIFHMHACKHGFRPCSGEDRHATRGASSTAQIGEGRVARFIPLCHPRRGMAASKRQSTDIRVEFPRTGMTCQSQNEYHIHSVL